LFDIFYFSRRHCPTGYLELREWASERRGEWHGVESMARAGAQHPTELELLILKILWEQAPMPVRDIRKRLAEEGRNLAHTSVITTLNKMFAKKQLRRRKQGNAFLFSPRIDRDAVSRQMLGDIVHRVFDGSASAVVLSLFDCSQIDEEDVKEMRRLFNRKVREQQP